MFLCNKERTFCEFKKYFLATTSTTTTSATSTNATSTTNTETANNPFVNLLQQILSQSASGQSQPNISISSNGN